MVDIPETKNIHTVMGNLTNEENWAARERLRRVEILLWWRGWVGRQDLVDGFGISPAQASGDLQRFAEVNPTAMIYQTSPKRYEATKDMVCRMQTPVFEDAVRFFFGGDGLPADFGAAPADERLATVNLPKRKIDPVVSRRLLMALLEQRVLRVRYMSLNSGSDEWREIVPGGLAWDGHRWHVRAWCGKSQEWRDFVLGRMVSADWPTKSAEELPEDIEWTTFEVIKVKINPKLSKERREALRVDYALPGEFLEIRVRRAMKSYLLAAMYIDHKSHRDLPRHFVLAE